MALDIEKTFQQIEAAAQNVARERDAWSERLASVLEAASRPGVARSADEKAEASLGRYAFLAASPREEFNARHQAPPTPDDFAVAAADGSHIGVDRHLPLRCYLINVGTCLLTYGSRPDAQLFSEPRLYSREEELYLTDPASGLNDVPVEGAVLGFKRSVQELQALVELARTVPDDLPLLSLVDGSLILWGLAGQRYPPFVTTAFIKDGLVPALDALRSESGRRPLALAAYVSLPGTTEVINALRLAFCPYQVADCHRQCSGIRAGHRPCDSVHGLVDRHLFQAMLEPGERSALFATRSSVVRDYYGPHRVLFYYLNVGEEVARVEVPAWVAEDEGLLGVAHALVLDQCHKGQGYPVALSEAHEQAVVSSADREQFRALVEEALWGQRLPVDTSEKNRSKRTRWL